MRLYHDARQQTRYDGDYFQDQSKLTISRKSRDTLLLKARETNNCQKGMTRQMSLMHDKAA